jgi:nucleoid-associated protein EbfC
MFKELGQMMQLMRTLPQQAGQLQEKMTRYSEQLAAQRFKGRGGQGLAEVEISGAMAVLSCTIKPGITLAEVETQLPNAIVEAMNGALHQAQEYSAKNMGQLTDGLDLQKLQGLAAAMGLGKPG